MSQVPPMRESIPRRLRRIVVRRRLTVREVADRAGLCDRTVERFLDGETFKIETADSISRALSVSLVEDPGSLLGGLPLWRLVGDPELWARLQDVARLLEVHHSSALRRVEGAVQRHQLSAGHIRRQVRDRDAIVQGPHNWLTRSPRGCTVVTCWASMWLLLTSDGRSGQRARAVLVEEQARRARRDGEFR